MSDARWIVNFNIRHTYVLYTSVWFKGKRGSRFFFPDDFESSPYPLRRYITQALT